MQSTTHIIPFEKEFETYEEYLKDKKATPTQRIAQISFFDPHSNLTAFKGERSFSEISNITYPLGKAGVCDELRRLLDKIVHYNVKPWKKAGQACANHFETNDLFKKIKSFKHSKTISCHSYSLTPFHDHLEKSSGLPIREIEAQVKAYGINYVVNKYFENIQDPKEGDLIIYQNHKGSQHSGIYKTEIIIESLWNSGIFGHQVFQHWLFFLPNEYGNEAKSYRPKPTHTMPPSYFFCDDSIPLNQGFKYFKNVENDRRREKIDTLKKKDLAENFPKIKWEEDIHFHGYCYGYALGKVFKEYSSPKNLSFVMPSQVFLDNQFTSVMKPQAGDLVVYYEYEGGKMVHFGIYTDDHRVESKWGLDDVYIHPPFFVSSTYGEFIRYYRKVNLSKF